MKKLDIQNPFSDGPVYYRDVTGSTMDDCKKDSSGKFLHGTVYLAGFQSNGRGRIQGRDWLADARLNLTFTLLLKRSELKHELNHMPLLAGIALVSAVSDYTGLDFSLKWPNDLLYRGRKTAGILCEADNENFYCGMGINCNQILFPGDLKEKATSLKNISGNNIDLRELTGHILQKLQYYINSGSLWRKHLENKLYRKGEVIDVLQGQAGDSVLIRGENLGIGADGQLIIRQLNGILSEIYAGEIEL